MDKRKVTNEVQTRICILLCERLTDFKLALRRRIGRGNMGVCLVGILVHEKIGVAMREVTDLYTLKRRVENVIKEELGEYELKNH